MAKSHWTKAEPRGCPLIDLVCFYLDDAAQKVIKNKGAPGIDGITYEQLPNLLRVHGEKIRQKLKNGTYIPAPVRRVDIPKPNEGTRMLGIPTLLDRTIQQAIVMTIGDADVYKRQSPDEVDSFEAIISNHRNDIDNYLQKLLNEKLQLNQYLCIDHIDLNSI